MTSDQTQLLLDLIVALWLMILGGSVGSFLNVLVYRLPRGESLLHPCSRCPACQTPILARDNIPVFGWLLLRGRCRACGEAISSRYPIVEAVCAGVLLVLARAELGGDSVDALAPTAIGRFLCHATLVLALVATALFSLDGQRVPRSVALAFAGIGLVVPQFLPDLYPVSAWPMPSGHRLTALITSLTGAGAGWILGRAIERFLERFSGINLPFALASVGMFLGWQAAITTALVATCLHLARRGGYLRESWSIGKLPATVDVTFATLIQILIWRTFVST